MLEDGRRPSDNVVAVEQRTCNGPRIDIHSESSDEGDDEARGGREQGGGIIRTPKPGGDYRCWLPSRTVPYCRRLTSCMIVGQV